MNVPRTTLGDRLAAVPATPVVAALLAASGVLAAGSAIATSIPSHRIWGVAAAVVYLAGAALCLHRRIPAVALRCAAVGAALLPAAVMIGLRIAQPEVGVVQRSAAVLLQTGSPYLAHVATIDDINPYLPLMSVFGLPAQLWPGSVWADPRPWFLLTLIGCLVAAARLTGRSSRPAGRHRDGSLGDLLGSATTRIWAVLACPLTALHAAVGGHDLPVIGLALLGLACAGAGRPLAAGAALGAAASMHALIWPVLPVAVILLAARWGAAAAVRSAAVMVGLIAATTLPFVIGADGATALAQIAGFPLGSNVLVSPADTPFPGVLLALSGPTGRTVAWSLLAAAAVAMAVLLIVRRPTTEAAAARLAAAGVTAAIVLLPASRWGYLVLPAALLLWTAFPTASHRRETGRPGSAPRPPAVERTTAPVPTPALHATLVARLVRRAFGDLRPVTSAQLLRTAARP